MGLLRFYLACVGRALRHTWYLIGLVSTVLTFAVPFALNRWANIDSAALNTFIWVMPFALLGLCLLVVPWVEAYHLYAAKEAELAVERKGDAEERGALTRRHAEEMAALQARLAARDNAARAELDKLIERGQAIVNALWNIVPTPPNLHPEAVEWVRLAYAFICDRTPRHLTDFLVTDPLTNIPTASGPGEVAGRLEQCLNVLRMVRDTPA